MEVLWFLFFFNCFFLSFSESDFIGAHSTEASEKKTYELELFPPKPTFAGQTRKPRTLFKKLHSKAAFLTGLKLGAILSKKGFELGHGKIASTHSFQIFGKSVNSAMSLSYGDTGGSLLPLVDDDPESESPKRRTDKGDDDKKIFHVTVVEDTSKESTEGLTRRNEYAEKPKEDKNEQVEKADYMVVMQDTEPEEEPEKKIESDFLKEHNKRVKEFNESIFKRQKKL